MKYAELVLLLVIVSCIAMVSPTRADGVREEHETYRLDPIPFLNNSACPSNNAFASACFHVLPGETRVFITVREESPTADLDLPILARLRFIGVAFPWVPFCDAIIGVIPEGSTGIVVEVQHGQRARYCEEESYSPALMGTVSATFHRETLHSAE